ncbi:MAG: hypothetical protein ABI538_06010 [Pseudoxanthomonas sp.]
MSVETCRAMLVGHPGGSPAQRPGDENMSCEQIFAELHATRVDGISDEDIARNEALTEQGRALAARHAAEIARQTAPSPLGRVAGVLPNATIAALMALSQARQVAATSNLKRQDQHYSAELREQIDANAMDLDALMAKNPRLAQLSELAIGQDCQPPAQ